MSNRNVCVHSTDPFSELSKAKCRRNHVTVKGEECPSSVHVSGRRSVTMYLHMVRK